jgi:hypothetical protein
MRRKWRAVDGSMHQHADECQRISVKSTGRPRRWQEEDFYRDAATQDFCGLANCFALRANVAADNLSPKRAFETEGAEKRATAG